MSAGVDYSANPTQLDEGALTELINMYMGPRGFVADSGLAQLGGTTRGIPRGAFEHETVAGVRTLILVTNDTVYEWVVAVEEWQYISDGVDTTLTADANNPDTSLTVASIAGFSDGDYIGVALNNGSEHQTTINGAPAGSTIVITDPIPDTGEVTDASSGNAVVKAKDLAGINGKPVVFTGVPWEEWSIFTNGVDPPQRYDGSTVEDIPNLPSGGSIVCKTLDVYKTFIILGGMIEGGTNLPYNERWSASGDGTSWPAANYNALVDSRDPIVAMKKLGDYHMIYHTKSVTRMSFIGALNKPFRWQTVNFGQSIKFEGVGAASPNSVYATEDEHVILNSKGVYIYSGGTSIERVSNKLEPEVFGARGWFDITKETVAFIAEFERRSWLLFFIPSTLGDFPLQAIVYDTNYRVWVGKRRFNRQITFSAPRIGGSALRYVDLVGTMAQQTWSAASAAVTGLALSSIVGQATPTGVYEYDYLQVTEMSGDPVIGELITKTFTGMDRPFRVQWIEVEHNFLTYILIGYDDAGWRLIGLLPSAGASLVRSRITIDNTYREIKIRCITGGVGATIRSIAVKSREAARWSI
jgi:hypothetical protein